MVLAAVALGILRTVLPPADKKVLTEHLGTLRSATSEALVLIEMDRTGRLTPSYLRTEASLLADDLSKTASALAAAKPEPELQESFRETSMLAARAASAMSPLLSPSPPASAGLSIRGLLAQIRARAMALQAELG